MRENIGLYRGKRIDNDKWLYGSLLKVTIDGETAWLIFGNAFEFANGGVRSLSHAQVDPNTVGECIGLQDKSGKMIFEGDILRYEYGGVCSVEYGRFNCTCCDGVYGWGVTRGGDIRDCEHHEVIGNIYDNPELLKGE